LRIDTPDIIDMKRKQTKCPPKPYKNEKTNHFYIHDALAIDTISHAPPKKQIRVKNRITTQLL
jgi:hypothetical protein